MKQISQSDLTQEYTPEDYPMYDNCDAIHVDEILSIPKHYRGVMCLPESYARVHNADLFDIIGVTGEHLIEKEYTDAESGELLLQCMLNPTMRSYIRSSFCITYQAVETNGYLQPYVSRQRGVLIKRK